MTDDPWNLHAAARLVPLEERERLAVMEVVNMRLLVDKKQAEGASKAELESIADRTFAALEREATLPGQHHRLLTMCDAMYAVLGTLKDISPMNRQPMVDRVTKAFLRTGSVIDVQKALKQCLDEMNARAPFAEQVSWINKVWARTPMAGWIGTERHKAFVAGIDPTLPVETAYTEFQGSLASAWAKQQGEEVPEQLTECATMLVATLEWTRASCPVFSLTDDFFHALAVTDFGTNKDDKDDILHMPFPSFVVNFPPNALLSDARKMFVHRVAYHTDTGTEWAVRLVLLTDPAVFTEWPADTSRWDFFHDELVPIVEEAASAAVLNKELVAMSRRILANMLSYIDASHGLPKEKHRHGAPPAPVEREHTEPRFRVGRPVKLAPQIRQVLKEGKAGKSWKLGHRFIVRGHFRNQAHGPNRSLRTRKWIEPFWKGPASMTEAFERSYSVE